MLVLTRKDGESITIGNNIKVFILYKQGGQTKVGIEAPDNVQILRTELLEKEGNESFNFQFPD